MSSLRKAGRFSLPYQPRARNQQLRLFVVDSREWLIDCRLWLGVGRRPPMRYLRVIAALAMIITMLGGNYTSKAAAGERYFAETGRSIRGAFQSYWEQHGGLARFGYPLTDEISEVSDLDGK